MLLLRCLYFTLIIHLNVLLEFPDVRKMYGNIWIWYGDFNDYIFTHYNFDYNNIV